MAGQRGEYSMLKTPKISPGAPKIGLGGHPASPVEGFQQLNASVLNFWNILPSFWSQTGSLLDIVMAML